MRRDIVGAIFIVMIGAIWFACDQVKRYKEVEIERDRLIQVNDSTQAVLARVTAEKEQLAALYRAEKALNGKLIAGLKIRVPAETVYVAPTEAPTQETPDSSRIAELTDTTDTGYVVTVRAEAPPYPAPLRLGYWFQVPPFEPQVGFVQTNDTIYAAVVSWAGRQYTIENAFFLSSKKRLDPKGLIANWSGLKSLVEDWELAGGFRWTTMQQSLYGAVRRDLWPDTKLGIEVGIGMGNYVGVVIERKFF